MCMIVSAIRKMNPCPPTKKQALYQNYILTKYKPTNESRLITKCNATIKKQHSAMLSFIYFKSIHYSLICHVQQYF